MLCFRAQARISHAVLWRETGWKWWEAVLLLRRLLLSLIAVFVSPPMLQSALAVSVLAGLLTVHAYARPYTSDAIDMLEVSPLLLRPGPPPRPGVQSQP
eukprot:340894-Rhodomonas_salina.1